MRDTKSRTTRDSNWMLARSAPKWVQRLFAERLSLRLEIGKYSADAFAADTLKMWLTLIVRI